MPDLESEVGHHAQQCLSDVDAILKRIQGHRGATGIYQLETGGGGGEGEGEGGVGRGDGGRGTEEDH